MASGIKYLKIHFSNLCFMKFLTIFLDHFTLKTISNLYLTLSNT